MSEEAPLSSVFPFNEEQLSAIEVIQDWIDSDIEEGSDAEAPYLVLSGPAGTGKTSCVLQLIIQNPDLRIAFTAPTNKATRVLRETVGKGRAGDCLTIYALLGLRLEASGMIKQLLVPETPKSLADYDLIICDEGSMVPRVLRSALDEARDANPHAKFLFMGDSCQLPPVGEERSSIFELPGPTLTKVMRHDNQILQLATHIRSKINLPFPRFALASNHAHDCSEGVFAKDAGGFDKACITAAGAGHFHSGHAKAIAWRNVTVRKLNVLIRAAGDQSRLDPLSTLPFGPGDRVIAKSPCFLGKDNRVAHTDDEGVVLSCSSAPHPHFPEYRGMRLEVRLDDGKREVVLWPIHPDEGPALKAMLKSLSDAAGRDRRKWKDYWKLREAFHDIDLAYAITAHRSQGSTYQETFVHVPDILHNPNKIEATKCLYVACSRPRKKLYLNNGG